MPSQRHESLVDLFRHQPQLVYDLLRRILDQRISTPRQVQSLEVGFSEIVPPEYRADLVLGGPRGPRVVVEVQLKVDPQKRKSWPVYIAGLGSRQPGGVLLVVVTPSRAVARWASKPIRTGHPGFTLQPLVLGPDTIPVIGDPQEARKEPFLAVLSAMAHGRGKNALAVGQAAILALNDLDDPHAHLYGDLVLSEMSRAARRKLEEFIMDKNGTPYRSELFQRLSTEHHLKGRQEGLVTALFSVLSARRLVISPEQQEQITACTDEGQLQDWMQRAVTATSVEEVLRRSPEATV